MQNWNFSPGTNIPSLPALISLVCTAIALDPRHNLCWKLCLSLQCPFPCHIAFVEPAKSKFQFSLGDSLFRSHCKNADIPWPSVCPPEARSGVPNSTFRIQIQTGYESTSKSAFSDFVCQSRKQQITCRIWPQKLDSCQGIQPVVGHSNLSNAKVRYQHDISISTLNRQHEENRNEATQFASFDAPPQHDWKYGTAARACGLDCFQRKSRVVNLCLRRLPAILQYLELSQGGSWSACTPWRELHFFSGTEPHNGFWHAASCTIIWLACGFVGHKAPVADPHNGRPVPVENSLKLLRTHCPSLAAWLCIWNWPGIWEASPNLSTKYQAASCQSPKRKGNRDSSSFFNPHQSTSILYHR